MEKQIIFCPNCGVRLRVPVNEGKLYVTCPKCEHGFDFDSDVEQVKKPQIAAMPTGKKKRKWRTALVVILLAAAVLFGVGVLAYAPQEDLPSGDTSSVASDVPGAGDQDLSQPGTDPGDDPANPDLSQDPGGNWQDTYSSVRERAQAIIPYFELRYFLNRLDDDALSAVCDIYDAATNFKEFAEFTTPVNSEDFSFLLSLMGDECPELFQYDYRKSTDVYRDAEGNYTKLQVPYRFTEEEYRDLRQACDELIAEFVRATEGMTDYEKEKYVFDYMASRDYYDLDAPYVGTAYGALVDGLAKCDGFSYAMKWAMEAMGMQCLFVSGAPTSPDTDIGHAWNIINLDGQYYRVDLTASISERGQDTYGMEGIRYFAFNVSDLMAADTDAQYEIRELYTHFAPIPACNLSDMSYYSLNEGFIPARGDYASAIKEWSSALLPDGGSFYAQFESYDAYKTFTDGQYESILQDVLKGQSDKYWYQTVWYGYNGVGIRIWHD